MPASDTARLIASLELKDLFSPNANKIGKSLGGLEKQIDRTQGRAYKAGTQIGVGIKRGAMIAAGGIAFLGSQIVIGLKELATLEGATAQTNAVLASTKGVSGQTADSVRNLAETYENLNATIDDKVIQSGENLLLTFTNIRKQAFEPALIAALNLNTRLGGGEGGLQNTIKLLGKALNDPLKGLGALSKAGITFSKQQTDQIKALIKNNDLLGAQDLILAELGKRYGGAFAAQGKTAAGAVAGIDDAAEDLQKTLASGLFPVVQKILPKIREALADRRIIAGAKSIGDSIAGLFSDANIAEGGKILSTVFDTARSAAPILKGAAETMFSLVKASVGLFRSLPDGIQQIAIGAFAINKLTGGLVTNIAGGIAEFLARRFTGAMNVSAGVVNVAGGAGLAGVAAGGSRLGGVLSAVGKVFLVGAAVGAFAELKSILDEQTGRNKAQAAGLSQSTALYVKSASLADMKASLAGIDAETKRLNNSWEGDGFAFRMNIDGVRDAVDATRAALVKAINAEKERLDDAATRTKDDTTDAIRAAADKQRDAIETVRIAVVSVKTAIDAAGGGGGGGGKVSAGSGPFGGKSSGGLPPGSGNIFVPDVVLDPSAVRRQQTFFPGKAQDDLADVARLAQKQVEINYAAKRVWTSIRDRLESARIATVSAANRTTAAVDRKKLAVTVPVQLTSNTYLNGRQLTGTLNRQVTLIARNQLVPS